MLQLYIVFKHKQKNILYKKALLTQFFIKSILLPKKKVLTTFLSLPYQSTPFINHFIIEKILKIKKRKNKRKNKYKYKFYGLYRRKYILMIMESEN